jgi:hypothetical protein
MTRGTGDRFLAGLLAGVAIVAAAAFSHLGAGGPIERPALALMLAAACVVGLGLASIRWTFVRLALVTVAAQPLLHLLFVSVGSHADGMSADAHAAHHSLDQHQAMLASSPHAGGTMWIVHAAAALAAAVVIRWGWRWLRSMPDLVRAIVYATCSAPVAAAARRVRMVVAEAWSPVPVVLSAWNGRGPPSPV